MHTQLTDLLSESDLALVVEGLSRLRAIKQEAFDVVSQPDVPGHSRFRPEDFAIPQITALLERFGEQADFSPLPNPDVPEGPRIVATLIKQTWSGASGNDAIEVARQQFDATCHVLAMDLDDIHSLKDHRVSTDEIGDAHIQHAGPREVEVTDAICTFFGTKDLHSITDDMLQAKREAYGVAPLQAALQP